MSSRRFLLPLLSLAAFVPALHAQMPADNLTWQNRCETLAAAQSAIQSGTMSDKLVASTRGIVGQDFTVLALDRVQAGQHAVACTLLYMAAIAERHGNGGHTDVSAAGNRAELAHAEYAVSHNLPVPFTTTLLLKGVEARHMMTATPSVQQVRAVIDAASTMPLGLTAQR